MKIFYQFKGGKKEKEETVTSRKQQNNRFENKNSNLNEIRLDLKIKLNYILRYEYVMQCQEQAFPFIQTKQVIQ